MPSGPEVFEVSTVEDAVELGHKFKAEGRYNWFRGQTQGWPPISSLRRLEEEEDAKKLFMHKRRVLMFYQWLEKIPAMRYLREPARMHDMFAIMQHYGIQTHYIDFSTDPGVAGFFASDTKTPPTVEKACIYCLDIDDLMSLWNAMKDVDERKGACIEMHEIDVGNLWRLQSQRGVFLFCNYNWQVDYPMDRIVFPYTGYPSYPTQNEIYPPDKSPLEQWLDQYFSLEQSTFANERGREMIEKFKAQGIPAGYFEWEGFQDGYYSEAFAVPPNELESWASTVLTEWNSNPVEEYHNSKGPTVRLQLPPGAEIEKVRTSIIFGMKQVLRSNPTYREKVVNFEFAGLPQSVSTERLQAVLRPVWNGMRRLPFTNTEIGAAFASVVALLILGFPDGSADEQLPVFSKCFGECLTVGFASLDGSDSRGVASAQDLQTALRKDISSLLVVKFQDRVVNVRELFGIIYNPKRMFEFESFRTIFARNVIPAQALWKREPMLFNPTQLQTFGLP
jgi:hypothetical protein